MDPHSPTKKLPRSMTSSKESRGRGHGLAARTQNVGMTVNNHQLFLTYLYCSILFLVALYSTRIYINLFGANASTLLEHLEEEIPESLRGWTYQTNLATNHI
jgi:hypothetical protein